MFRQLGFSPTRVATPTQPVKDVKVPAMIT